MKGITTNLVDIVWGSDKPPRPNEKIQPLGLEYSGKSSEEKITDLRKELEKKKSAGLILCESTSHAYMSERPELTHPNSNAR